MVSISADTAWPGSAWIRLIGDGAEVGSQVLFAVGWV
jgi:hypothetical protein